MRMDFRAGILAAVLLSLSSLAVAAPGGHSMFSKRIYDYDSTSGSLWIDQAYFEWNIASYKDPTTGVRVGDAFIVWQDGVTGQRDWSIFCFGAPSLGNVTLVNPGNGNASVVNAVFDPDDPNCSFFGFSTSITFDVSIRSNGALTLRGNGTQMEIQNGRMTYRINYQNDCFNGGAFSAHSNIPGFSNFEGNNGFACAFRAIDRVPFQ